MRVADLAQAKVLIIGGGVTGISVAEILENIGSEISILDEDSSLLADDRFVTAEHALSTTWDFAIVSPGWRPEHPLLQALSQRGIQLLSEIDLAWRKSAIPFGTDSRRTPNIPEACRTEGHWRGLPRFPTTRCSRAGPCIR